MTSSGRSKDLEKGCRDSGESAARGEEPDALGSRGENLERLLKPLDLGLTLSDPLRVRHHLRLALRLELVEVRKDRIELLARGGEVLLVVQEGRLLGLHLGLLALHLLGVRRLRDGVLLRELVV